METKKKRKGITKILNECELFWTGVDGQERVGGVGSLSHAKETI